MTARRPITNSRPPAFVSRETGAAELDLSVDTWDAMVKAGKLPPPVPAGITGATPRWLWDDVKAAMLGKMPKVQSEPEPYFRRISNGPTKERRRGTS